MSVLEQIAHEFTKAEESRAAALRKLAERIEAGEKIKPGEAAAELQKNGFTLDDLRNELNTIHAEARQSAEEDLRKSRLDRLEALRVKAEANLKKLTEAIAAAEVAHDAEFSRRAVAIAAHVHTFGSIDSTVLAFLDEADQRDN